MIEPMPQFRLQKDAPNGVNFQHLVKHVQELTTKYNELVATFKPKPAAWVESIAFLQQLGYTCNCVAPAPSDKIIDSMKISDWCKTCNRMIVED